MPKMLEKFCFDKVKFVIWKSHGNSYKISFPPCLVKPGKSDRSHGKIMNFKTGFKRFYKFNKNYFLS